MGAVRWLDRIDPATWRAAVERMEQEGEALLEPEAASSFLREFGREPKPESLDALADAEEESIRPTLLNGLFEAAVREQEWYLDKSLNRLEVLARALPGGEPLLDITEFRGIEVEPPRALANIEGGLFGCITTRRLESTARLLRSLAGRAEVEAAAHSKRLSVLARLTGGARRREAAVAVLREDYHSHYWSVLREAVLVTFDAGHYLGLGMSP